MIGGAPQEDERASMAELRPRTLAEYDVGQRRLIDGLRVAIDAARQRGEVLDHVLLDGPPGLGKTTLAHIIANEMGGGFQQSSGPSLERASDLVGILTNLDRSDVLFIDEIHRLPRVVEEYLYSAMEDFRIDFVVDSGPYARTIPLELQPFTLVGATTRAGLLTPPLRNRFGIFYHLDFYTPEQLELIVQRSARILGVELQEGGARQIACRSRGTARVANRLLRRVRDYAQIMGDGRIDEEIACEALEALGVDEMGLDDLDRKYLHALIDYYSGGPAGANALAATLHEEQDTLEDVVEPYLLKIGFVIRTPRGRIATERAHRHLGLTVRPPGRPGPQGNLPLQ
ncbi:MAG: Holliday junction branch migration DNA helicase RuvB [Armatimonadota bacterium]